MLSKQVKVRIAENKRRRRIPAWMQERNEFARGLREIAKANMLFASNGHFGKSYPTPSDINTFSLERYQKLLDERKAAIAEAKTYFVMDRHTWHAFKAAKAELLAEIRSQVYYAYHASGSKTS